MAVCFQQYLSYIISHFLLSGRCENRQKGYPQVKSCNAMCVKVSYERMSNRGNTIQVRLTDGEKKMLEALCTKWGSIPMSDVIRRCLLDRFKKEFPVYLAKEKRVAQPVEEITDEQFCESYGGKVGKNDGGMTVCIKGVWSVPLERRDMIKQRFKE